MTTASIDVAGVQRSFDLDFENETWHSSTEFDEEDFPLIAELQGKRYQLYSDGTFDEEER